MFIFKFLTAPIRHWLKMALLVLILATSLVLNTIYLPKYFMGQGTNNETVSTVIINVENTIDANDSFNTPQFVTTFKFLGDMMAKAKDYYELNFSAGLGHFLTGVRNKKGEMIYPPTWKAGQPYYYWCIEKLKPGTKDDYEALNTGIDITPLSNNDVYKLVLTK